MKTLIIATLVLLLSVPCHSAERQIREASDGGGMLLKPGEQQGECEGNVCKSEGFWNEEGKNEDQAGSSSGEDPYAFPEQKGDEKDGGGTNGTHGFETPAAGVKK